MVGYKIFVALQEFVFCCWPWVSAFHNCGTMKTGAGIEQDISVLMCCQNLQHWHWFSLMASKSWRRSEKRQRNWRKAAWHQQIPSQLDGNNRGYKCTWNDGCTNLYVGKLCFNVQNKSMLKLQKMHLHSKLCNITALLWCWLVSMIN